ncbi:uncharacterized protein [Elaeis guineensis]|uniref:uncharacterized protein n=1 Tax=Elaeis guineensis var. tenera TaxID=51953 RepID=UPI003C6DB067
MSKKKDPERDIGWDHGEMLSVRHHWRCKWCNIEFKGGGMTRLKQHLARGYPDVSMCRKCPQEVRQLMKKHFADSKAAKERAKQKKTEIDRRAAELLSYHSRESEEASAPDDEAQIEAAIQTSLADQYQQEEMARYRERFGPSYYESRSGSATSRGEFELRRTTSVREPGGRGSRRSMFSLLGAFGRRRSSRDIPAGASIQDLDPHALSCKDSKQQRIDSMLKKDKKKDMWRAIGS